MEFVPVVTFDKEIMNLKCDDICSTEEMTSLFGWSNQQYAPPSQPQRILPTSRSNFFNDTGFLPRDKPYTITPPLVKTVHSQPIYPQPNHSGPTHPVLLRPAPPLHIPNHSQPKPPQPKPPQPNPPHLQPQQTPQQTPRPNQPQQPPAPKPTFVKLSPYHTPNM